MNKKLTTSLVAGALLATNLFANNDSAVTITAATKSKQSIQDVTSVVNVITAQELEEKQVKTLPEALTLIPGVNIVSQGGIGSATDVLVRGASNNRVLVLVDGVRYKDNGSISGTTMAHIMVDNVERIEVVKGAQSGIWGADASVAVVNIITKEAKEGFNAEANIEMGSYKTREYGVLLSHRTNIYDIMVNANRIMTDSFSVQAPKGRDVDNYENDPYENTTVNAKIGVNPTDDSRVQFAYTHIKAEKDFDGFNAPDDSTRVSYSDDKIYSLAYQQTLGNHNIKLQVEQTEFNKERVGETFGVKQTVGENKGVELNDHMTYGEKDFIVVGAGALKEKMKYTTVANTSNSLESEGKFVYLTNSNHFGNVVVTESIRHDDYDNFDSKTTGKLGVKLFATKDLELFTNIGTAYTVPLLIQNLNPWGAVNERIQPEESKSIDLGFKYKNFSATYFHQKVDNLIEWYDPTPLNFFNNDAYYQNLDGKSTLKGLELEYSKDILADTLLSLNYTYLSAKNDEEETLRRRPNQTIRASVDYYGVRGLHLNLNGEYIGKRYEGNGNTGTQTGKYMVWNGIVNYTISKNVKAYVKFDNILDKDYQISEGYATAGRSAYIGLKASF